MAMHFKTIQNLLIAREGFNNKLFKDLTKDEKRILYICELWNRGKTFEGLFNDIYRIIDQISKNEDPDFKIDLELREFYNDESVVKPMFE